MRRCDSEIPGSGMRQLAGTKTKYRMAHAAPLTGLISGRAKYNRDGGCVAGFVNKRNKKTKHRTGD